ncbi:MAG: response regulator [Hyphomicrobiales bacterium]|nr:response regulator [Hyphomicrobiales bacterium]
MEKTSMLREAIEVTTPIQPTRVVAVDDEVINLEIIEKHVKKAGYDVRSFEDPLEAWNYMQLNQDAFDIVVLDKMMPRLDGFEILKRLKAVDALKHRPVIMQTAAISKEDAVAAIEAGAYYYITKPYDAEVLISVVNAAARDYAQEKKLMAELGNASSARRLVKGMQYAFKTLRDARAVAAHIAGYTPEPSRTVVGVMALLVNAVEHGNLGIGYEKKMELLANHQYEAELQRRAESPVMKERDVNVSFVRTADSVVVTIKDEGEGFDWKHYMDFEPRRMTDPNGRGIAMANIIEPGGLKYIGKGNELQYTIRLNKNQNVDEAF